MPLNTRVGRCVTKLKKKYGYGPAIGICQRSTKQNYMTGKSMRKKTRRRKRRKRKVGGFLSNFWGTWNKKTKKGVIPGSWTSNGMKCNPYLPGQCPGGGVCKPSGLGIGGISFGGKCYPRGGGGKKSKRRIKKTHKRSGRGRRKRNRRRKTTKRYTR